MGSLVISECQICRNRAELAPYRDGRMICGDCKDAMLAGEARRGIPPAEVQPDYVPENVQSPPPPAGERESYLRTLRRATPEIIDRIIRRLVRERVFHVEFDHVVRNERWFSLMDLRKISLEVEASLKLKRNLSDNSKHRRRSKCLSQPPRRLIRTPHRQSHRSQPNLTPLPDLALLQQEQEQAQPI